MRSASAIVCTCLCATASFADVSLIERNSSLSTYYFSGAPFGSYDDTISGTTPGPIALANHNAFFNSDVTAYSFSASMNGGSRSSSGTNGRNSTALQFRFAVTDSPELFSLTINTGSIFPYFSLDYLYASLRLTSAATGHVLFDLRTDAPPTMGGSWSPAIWTNAQWSTLLAPGEYILQASAAGGPQYSVGPGAGGYSTTAFSFSGTITPTPAAGSLLACTVVTANTRRRRYAAR